MPETTPASPTRKRRGRVWRWLAGVLLGFLLLLLGVVLWAGSDGSLPRALQLAQRFLPQDQLLTFSDSQGSITAGGTIGRLQWSKPGITVTVDNLQLDWSLRQLLGRELHVRTLAARNVQVRLTQQPEEPDTPFTMPADASLPIRMTLPLSIARLQIETVDAEDMSNTQVLEDLRADYRYDGEQHALRLDSLRYGASTAQGELQLHARELRLSAQLEASLRDLVPDTPLAMQATLQASGTLAGAEEARLDIRLDAATTQAETRISGQAIIHPWRGQPAHQIDLQINGLDAHAFHRQAPVTALNGSASLEPVADPASGVRDIRLDMTNDQPGAWDQQHLPLRQLTARAQLSSDLLAIETARAELAGRAPAGHFTLTGQIPLLQLAQTTLQLDLQRVDLQPLLTTLPRTAFTGPLTIQPWQQDSWQAQADVRNTAPGPLDQDRLPLDRMQADVRLAPDQWHIETLELQIGTGRMLVQGEFAPRTQALDLRGEVQRLPLRRIHRKMATDPIAELSGKLVIAGTLQQGLNFSADMAGDARAGAASQRGQWEIRSIQTEGSWSPTRLMIRRIHLDAFQATLDGSDIDVVLPGLDSVQGRITAAAPGAQLTADAAMLQQSGGGTLSLQLASAEQVATWLQGLPLIGERLPALQASGTATIAADWQGGWQQWEAGLRNPASQPQLRLNAIAQSDGLRVDVPGTAGDPPTRIEIEQLDLDVRGNLAAATIAIDGAALANDTHAQLAIHMQVTQLPGAADAPGWNVVVEEFNAAATLPDQNQAWQLQISEGLQVAIQTGDELEVRASAGNATLSAPSSSGTGKPLILAWQPLQWLQAASGATTLQSTGIATGIQPAWMDVLLGGHGEGPIAAAGLRTDLSLGGEWDIQMTDSVNIRARLKRESGELWLLDSETPAGIRNFEAEVQSAGENVNLALSWDTERAGIITARVGTRLARESGGWKLPGTAPISGNIQARLQDLNAWAFLAPPGWRIQGALDANIDLGGTVQAPRLDGSIEGKGLNLRSVLDGVDLHDGTLRASLSGTRLEVAELNFQGGTGSRAHVRGFSGNRTPPPAGRGRMSASGSIDWSGVAGADEAESGIVMDLRAELQRMQVLVRNDRQMTLSGDLSAALQEGALRIRGDIRVDRAAIVLPDASAPTLGDDVVVVRNADLQNPGAVEASQARGELKTRKPMDMEIKLDLGSDLALEGHGLTTRLEGDLTVRSNPNDSAAFNVFGEVRTVEGRYRAWGQALNVETGVVRFNGPYSNPSLDLLAIRPDIEVRAGVRVSGTLVSPRVQLFSDPDLPEGEKLSWVVLGRETVIAGTEGSSMQQAALGLAAGQLSGKVASGIGLDELGLGESGVTIGKRLSDELYLTYEAGLSGAASTLFIFYDITRRLTLRAQTGEASAVDMIYTIKYD